MVTFEISKQQFMNSTSKVKTVQLIDNRYQVTNICLGQGAFGRVFACLDTSTQNICAIKQISKAAILAKINQSSDREFTKYFFIRSLRSEADIMSKLKHENIIRFYHRNQNQHIIYFILEYCNQGTLQERLHAQKVLNLEVAFPIMTKLVKACNYMHKNGVFHRDIKPQNILMSCGEPKLSDFGLSIEIDTVDEQRYVWSGTTEFMAPEVLEKKEITLKSDVWSLGVTFYRIICGKLPWNFSKDNNYIGTILNTPLSFPVELDIPLRLQKIIRDMLEINFKKRPSMDLLNDYFNF